MSEPHTVRREVVIDLNADGTFREPPRLPVSARILRVAIIVGVLAGVMALAALALASLFVLVPLALGAAGVGYGAWRFRMWQARRQGPPAG